MLKALGKRLTFANVTSVTALVFAMAGGAYALTGIPDRGGVFHGCVSNATGVLRVVKSANSCQKAKTFRRRGKTLRLPGEFAVAWNQQGRTGPPGAPGAPGSPGVPGANGATNVVVRTTSIDLDAGIGSAIPIPFCNPGERAVGGGGGFTTVSGGKTVYSLGSPDEIHESGPVKADSSVPASGEPAVGWLSDITNGGTTRRTATHFVLCASP